MTHRTVVLSSYEAYLSCEDDSAEVRAAEGQERDARLVQFPYAVMLEVAFAELDFANRWCWQSFGPAYGECILQTSSEYPACTLNAPHCHAGQWSSYFFVKTAYDFGFCEWYFSDPSHRDRFLANIPNIHWGERYPK